MQNSVWLREKVSLPSNYSYRLVLAKRDNSLIQTEEYEAVEAYSRVDDVLRYNEQVFTDEQKAQIKNNIGILDLPAITPSDVGKFLRVSSDGKWSVEALINVAEVGA